MPSSTYDKNREPENYAERQIHRAHDYDLAQINADFEGVEEDVAEDENWPGPEPLGEDLLPVEPFDYELLPNAFRGLVRDAATSMQSPPDFVAIAIMIAAGAVIGGKCSIRPKQADDWKENPNLWGVAIGPPSVKKTPGIGYGMKPLKLLEAKARELLKAVIAKYLKAKERYDIDLKTWKSEYEKICKKRRARQMAENEDERENLTEEETVPASRDAPDEPKARRYVTNSSTVEALGEICIEDPRGVLIERDELISLLQMLDREDKAEDRGFYLTGWNAKQDYVFDRIQRGTRYIPSVIISIIGSSQPGGFSALPSRGDQVRRRRWPACPV